MRALEVNRLGTTSGQDKTLQSLGFTSIEGLECIVSGVMVGRAQKLAVCVHLRLQVVKQRLALDQVYNRGLQSMNSESSRK